jgi:hypothetical protein
MENPALVGLILTLDLSEEGVSASGVRAPMMIPEISGGISMLILADAASMALSPRAARRRVYAGCGC